MTGENDLLTGHELVKPHNDHRNRWKKHMKMVIFNSYVKVYQRLSLLVCL